MLGRLGFASGVAAAFHGATQRKIRSRRKETTHELTHHINLSSSWGGKRCGRRLPRKRETGYRIFSRRAPLANARAIFRHLKSPNNERNKNELSSHPSHANRRRDAAR